MASGTACPKIVTDFMEIARPASEDVQPVLCLDEFGERCNGAKNFHVKSSSRSELAGSADSILTAPHSVSSVDRSA